MSIRVRCPNDSCAKAMTVEDRYAGKTGKCPACGSPVPIPRPAADPEAEPAAPNPAPALGPRRRPAVAATPDADAAPGKKGPPWAWIGGGVAAVAVLGLALTMGLRSMGQRVRWENFGKLQAGMTREEVEALVGPGEVVEEQILPFGPAGKPRKFTTVRWHDEQGGLKQEMKIGFVDGRMGLGGAPGDLGKSLDQLVGNLNQLAEKAGKDGMPRLEFPKPAPPPPPMDAGRALAALKGSPPERSEALRWLADATPGEAHRAEIARQLDELLAGTDDAGTRDAAATALVAWATPENVPTLIKMLEHPSDSVRKSSIKALGKLKDTRAVRPLAARLGNAFEWDSAFAAIQAMGPPAEPELLPLLANEDANVRDKVRKLLKLLGSKEDVNFLQARADLESEDDGRRQAGAEWFERARPDEARHAEVAPLLTTHLNDDDRPGVRDACMKALARWATAEDVPALLGALNSKSGSMRESAMQALARLKDRRAVAPIARQLAHDRQHARAALLAMGPIAEGAVAEYLLDRDRGLRLEACSLLKAMGTTNSLSALKLAAMRDRDKDVSRAALDAMRTITARRR